MRYNCVAHSFHIKKLRSRFSSSEVRFNTENNCFASFIHFGGSGAAYTLFVWRKIWTDLSSVMSQCMRLTDRRTDSFFVNVLHLMQRGKKQLNIPKCSVELPLSNIPLVDYRPLFGQPVD